jgi:Family of unknown function (DUF6174)
MMKSTGRNINIQRIMGLALLLIGILTVQGGRSEAPGRRRAQEDGTVPSEVQSALDDAMALWTSQGITSYTLGFTRQCYCLEEYLEPFVSTVDNGSITEVLAVARDEFLDPSDPLFSAAYTIESLFSMIQSAVDAGSYVVTVEYDTTYGYPRSLLIDDERTADEETAINVDSFVAFDSTETSDPSSDDITSSPTVSPTVDPSSESSTPLPTSMGSTGTDAPTMSMEGTDAPTMSMEGTDAPTMSMAGTDAPTISMAGTNAPTVRPQATPTAPPVDLATMRPTFASSTFEGPQECSLNDACAQLAGDCCPTIDNVYLCKWPPTPAIGRCGRIFF